MNAAGASDDFDKAASDERGERGAGNFECLQRWDGEFTPGGSERVDQSLLVGIEFAFGGFQNRYFDRARRVLRGGEVLAREPFFANHSCE